MLPSRFISIAVIAVALLAQGTAAAQDGERTVPYLRTSGFNVPVLESWENQSTDVVAQFHLTEAEATIRTTMVAGDEPLEAARSELAGWLSVEIGAPVYSGKVNLADGTWQSLIFDIDAATTASVMARRDDANVIVLSYVESSPTARTLMLTLAQADDSLNDASPEIARSLDQIAGVELAQLEDKGTVTLPSGDWRVYESDGYIVTGMVFGNDSYVALQEGALGDLAGLADAYNRTLLGFFITPDNSLYLALGLALTFAILGTLVLSFFWRARTIRKDLALLNALSEDRS